MSPNVYANYTNVLTVTNADYDNEGGYICKGTNELYQTFYARGYLTVIGMCNGITFSFSKVYFTFSDVCCKN